VVITAITRVNESGVSTDQDLVAAEAPLEILLAHAGPHAGPHAATQSLGLVMRTPGDDEDLVLGLLVSEQIVREPGEVRAMTFQAGTGPDADAADAHPARARVTLVDEIDLGALASMRALDRTSACGLCGRLTIESLRCHTPPLLLETHINAQIASELPQQLRTRQSVFDETGGLHAAGLFALDGTYCCSAEDVGRHNAVDKVVGTMLFEERVPLRQHVLAVSGRASFEIVQKAWLAGIPIVCAVSAPSSLAIELADEAGITLLGFVRDGGFNLYTHPQRIDGV
jgi:FdhD protein